MLKDDKTYFCWLVAYIEAEHIKRVEKDLQRSPSYKEVEAYIPTVKILKKRFKGKEQFEEVPLLFNYGFFRVPREKAISKAFLDNMQKDITCIYAWVKDPLKVMGNPRIKPDGGLIYNDTDIPIATASSEEIQELLQASFSTSVHTAEDIEKLNPGDMITLRGYPWEGMQAEVKEISLRDKTLKVNIHILNEMREVGVSFDNVFFTVYHNRSYDDRITTTASLDEMVENRTVNQKIYKNAKNKQD